MLIILCIDDDRAMLTPYQGSLASFALVLCSGRRCPIRTKTIWTSNDLRQQPAAARRGPEQNPCHTALDTTKGAVG